MAARRVGGGSDRTCRAEAAITCWQPLASNLSACDLSKRPRCLRAQAVTVTALLLQLQRVRLAAGVPGVGNQCEMTADCPIVHAELQTQ